METEVQINGETRGIPVEGHFGTWHTVERKEIDGEPFFRMEHDEYGDSVASIIVGQKGEIVAEDLEHGFDQGTLDAIREYMAEKGGAVEAPQGEKVSMDTPKSSRKQSVLNALRQRQARVKAIEKQEQELQAHRKGEMEL